MRSLSKLKRHAASAVFFSGLLVSLQLKADTACSINCNIDVLFQGVYNDETCNISVNSGTYSETVLLPTISTSALKVSGAEAGNKGFDITLKDCPSDRIVAVTFISNQSAADTTTGNLVNTTGTEYSENVQVRIRKENGTQVVIDDAATGQDYAIPAAGGDVTHQYTASYYAKGSDAVTAGKLRSLAGVELVYK